MPEDRKPEHITEIMRAYAVTRQVVVDLITDPDGSGQSDGPAYDERVNAVFGAVAVLDHLFMEAMRDKFDPGEVQAEWDSAVEYIDAIDND